MTAMEWEIIKYWKTELKDKIFQWGWIVEKEEAYFMQGRYYMWVQ